VALRERKRLATWRGIRDAALRLFEEQGYEATTVDQIAEAAQVSRATFFNYFASKEAVVFDQDPEARQQWQALMDGRPPTEPLWATLEAVLLDFSETLRERMPLQRRLKEQSPALQHSTQDFGDKFHQDLQSWVAARADAIGEERLLATLQLNVALAALRTAYQTWGAEETFDDFIRRARSCLSAAAPTLHGPG
jgi:AcrR family transcriptional regulator